MKISTGWVWNKNVMRKKNWEKNQTKNLDKAFRKSEYNYKIKTPNNVTMKTEHNCLRPLVPIPDTLLINQIIYIPTTDKITSKLDRFFTMLKCFCCWATFQKKKKKRFFFKAACWHISCNVLLQGKRWCHHPKFM